MYNNILYTNIGTKMCQFSTKNALLFVLKTSNFGHKGVVLMFLYPVWLYYGIIKSVVVRK